MFGAKIQIGDEEVPAFTVEPDLLAGAKELGQVGEGYIQKDGVVVLLFQFAKHEMFLGVLFLHTHITYFYVRRT